MQKPWIIRVIRFDGTPSDDQTFVSYTDAKDAFKKVVQLDELERDKAGGRVKLINTNGVVLNTALIE